MPPSLKTDLLREHRDEYAAVPAPALIRTGPARYLTVTGTGGPQGADFRRGLGALYGCAYTIKFARKKTGRDFKVGILEGLWWADGGEMDWRTAAKGGWHWKLLIRVPGSVNARELQDALKSLRAKRGAVADVKLETIREGRVVQMLHVGPYADEPRSLAEMNDFVRSKGLRYRGLHHEIYLSDPRRVAPSKLRTIIRHPVAGPTGRASRRGDVHHV